MREYDTLLAIILLLVFGLLGYHFGQTQKEKSQSVESLNRANVELTT